MRKKVVKWTVENTEAFFAELGKHGVILRAAHSIGINPKSVYARKLRDNDFARRIDETVR